MRLSRSCTSNNGEKTNDVLKKNSYTQNARKKRSNPPIAMKLIPIHACIYRPIHLSVYLPFLRFMSRPCTPRFW